MVVVEEVEVELVEVGSAAIGDVTVDEPPDPTVAGARDCEASEQPTTAAKNRHPKTQRLTLNKTPPALQEFNSDQQFCASNAL